MGGELRTSNFEHSHSMWSAQCVVTFSFSLSFATDCNLKKKMSTENCDSHLLIDIIDIIDNIDNIDTIGSSGNFLGTVVSQQIYNYT